MNAPREYALTQKHKHLKEMKAITGLSREPLFTPIVDDYYSGMIVNIPLYVDMIGMKPEELQKVFADFYKGEKFINVKPFDAQTEELNGLWQPTHAPDGTEWKYTFAVMMTESFFHHVLTTLEKVHQVLRYSV